MKTIPLSDFEELAICFSSLMDGDTHMIEDAFALLRKYNLVDEDNIWIYNEDD